MNSFLPPTITPVEDEPTYAMPQQAPIIETAPTITPVDPEPQIQYVEEPQIQYVEQPQIEYVEQPQIEYVEEPQVQYVEQPQVQYVETPQVQQVVEVPQVQQVVVPVAQPAPQQDDLTKYYAILDGFGPVEPDDDFQLDGWKQFYPADDPFFNWQAKRNGCSKLESI